MAIDSNFVIYSTPNVYSTERIISTFISLTAVHHHWVYYGLAMACSPDGLISVMDRVLSTVIAKVGVIFLVKSEIFQVLFQPLRLLTQLHRSFQLSLL